jgi:hypothetical protein
MDKISMNTKEREQLKMFKLIEEGAIRLTTRLV